VLLSCFKAENDKFFGIQEGFKARLAELQRTLQLREAEKEQLTAMCNELLTRAEKEGMAV
jgi:hypothetical protein